MYSDVEQLFPSRLGKAIGAGLSATDVCGCRPFSASNSHTVDEHRLCSRHQDFAIPARRQIGFAPGLPSAAIEWQGACCGIHLLVWCNISCVFF